MHPAQKTNNEKTNNEQKKTKKPIQNGKLF